MKLVPILKYMIPMRYSTHSLTTKKVIDRRVSYLGLSAAKPVSMIITIIRPRSMHASIYFKWPVSVLVTLALLSILIVKINKVVSKQ